MPKWPCLFFLPPEGFPRERGSPSQGEGVNLRRLFFYLAAPGDALYALLMDLYAYLIHLYACLIHYMRFRIIVMRA